VRARSLAIHRILAWLHVSSDAVRTTLRAIAHHTGLPVVFVAAIGLALSWRVLRRGVGLMVEVAVTLALLLFATHLGWIRW